MSTLKHIVGTIMISSDYFWDDIIKGGSTFSWRLLSWFKHLRREALRWTTLWGQSGIKSILMFYSLHQPWISHNRCRPHRHRHPYHHHYHYHLHRLCHLLRLYQLHRFHHHYHHKVVGQFGTGQFCTGQFGTKMIKTDNLAPNNLTPGQFGTHIIKRDNLVPKKNYAQIIVWQYNFLCIVLKSKKHKIIILFAKHWRRKSPLKIFFLHPCGRQGAQTHHNLTYMLKMLSIKVL